MGNFPKDEETVPVSTRACARLLAVLEVLGVCPESPVNPVDAAAFVLEGVVDAVAQLNSAATKHASEPDIPDGSATSKCPDGLNQEGVVVDCPPHLRHQLGHCDSECEFCATKDAVVAVMQTPEGFQKVVDILVKEPAGKEQHSGFLCRVCGEDLCEHSKAKLNGLLCVECDEDQYSTPSGATCRNGHGGAEGYDPEPTEEELEALDELTHAANCRIWNENEETDCDCGAGAVDDGHEYEHGGEA